MIELREEIFIADLFKKRVASGVVVLGIRKVILQLMLTLTSIILARILLPEIFGAFGIISFLILTFGLISNFGMGPALVQYKGAVTKGHLQSIFTLLFIASLLFVSFVYVFAPVINSLYRGQLGETGILWLRIFSFSVLLDHTATISMHLLQRNLDFHIFTFGEILTTLITQIVTVTLVIVGFGLGGLVLGNLIGKLFAIVVFFVFRPWPIGLHFSRTDIKPFLPFGLNFQMNNLINSFGGAVVPIVVGSLTGPRSVGFINWAGGIKGASMAPFETIERLIFPAVARAQDNHELLKNMVEKMLKLSCLLSFPLMAIIAGLAEPFIKIVYTEKWFPGLTTLYLSLVHGAFVLLGTLMMDVLLALGKAKMVRNISLFWAILQWILTVPLVMVFGFNGVLVASILVSVTLFVPLFKVKKTININVSSHVVPYMIYAGITGCVMYILQNVILIDSFVRLFIAGGLGIGVYAFLLLLFEKKTFKTDILKLRKLIGR